MRKTTRYHSDRFRLNNQLMWPVLGVVFLSPFAFGSTKPSFWLLWSVLLSLCGTILFARMALSGARFRIAPRNLMGLFGLFAVLGIYMAFQALPLGSLAPSVSTVADPTARIALNTISLTPHDTILALTRWANYGLLFFLVLQMTSNPQRARVFINLVYWAIVIHAVVGLLFLLQFGDTILGIPKWKYFGSAMGGFINRNSYATFLAFGSVIGINLMIERMTETNPGKGDSSLFSRYLGKGGVVIIGLGWIVLVMTLIATNSRMGVFAACCGMIASVLMALAKRTAGTNRIVIWTFLLLIPAIVGLGIIGYGTTFIERVGDVDAAADVRMQLYQQVVTMIETRPFLGFGGNSFEYAYPLFHQAPVSVDLVWDKAHSTYLALWAEYGLVFGSIPMLIVATILFQLGAAYLKVPGQDMLLRSGIGIILVGAVHSLVDFSLEIEAVTFAFVVIVATAWARRFELGNTGDRGAA
ncbi:MAG TPA: O-antigen ligase family protein [Pararhizobium sp.]|uniref:O-antigen ligase family protein n=1 Tax=Pararhizobium sp. TaxID=1977563 RepID=UPI002BE48804|nr:O-antigen ligase family protein [Pararhizobium sp.]HTO29654.1 O-antigen ligase family protein [Pararhizobium sp.]